MRAQPFRLVTVCYDLGIISPQLYERIMSKLRPKGARDKSLWSILASDVSFETFRDLALYELPNPLKQNDKNEEEYISNTVRLQKSEILDILLANKPNVGTLVGLIEKSDPSQKDALNKLPQEKDDPEHEQTYRALVERNILTPSLLQTIVEAHEHPYFDDNRLPLIRRIFSLNGILNEAEFDKAVKAATEEAICVSEVLHSKGTVNENDLQRVLMEPLDLPSIALNAKDLDESLSEYFPNSAVRRDLFITFEYGKDGVDIAVTDPLNYSLSDTLSILIGRPVHSYYAPSEQIIQKINQIYKSETTPRKKVAETVVEQASEGEEDMDVEVEAQELDTIIDTMSTVQLVSTIMESALDARATDIHLEPQDEHLRVRFRIDGALHPAMDIPHQMTPPTISRVKVLANMDVTERRRPQDGHFSLKVRDDKYDFRVATIPTNLGEKIVIRTLREQAVAEGLNELGLDAKQSKAMGRLLERTYGAIMSTGPTGSGKTTTLYTALNLLNNDSRNITTIEDPVEYQLPGVNQVQVDRKSDMTFANGLRAIMRQDPDVILVGEVRDSETAQVMIRAALTGHLVFTTLHTNTSAGAIMMLMQMGIPHYLIASAVAGVVAQRLVRRLCGECKTEMRPNKTMLKNLGLHPNAKPKMFKPTGCNACWETGYSGRVGIFEVLEVNDAIRTLITENESDREIMKTAVANGMMTLRENAINKMKEGVTSYEEIMKHIFMNV